jgi:hypothetical protein
VRRGRRERVAARALRLEDLLAVGSELRRRRGVRLPGPGDGGDVGRDVDRVLALDEILRHRRVRLPDLVEHDVLDRALLEPLRAVARERVVEVRPHGALRACVGEHVTAGALGGGGEEELLAVRRVGGRRRLAAGATASEQEKCAEERESAPH